MKKLNSLQIININGGDWTDRYKKQFHKCATGNRRSCKRMVMIMSRHMK